MSLTQAEKDELQIAVSKGAAWMDEVLPGWVVDVEAQRRKGTFDMSDCDVCVLGSCFVRPEKEGWDAGVDLLEEEGYDVEEFGFDVPGYRVNGDTQAYIAKINAAYALMTDLWGAEVQRRIAA